MVGSNSFIAQVASTPMHTSASALVQINRERLAFQRQRRSPRCSAARAGVEDGPRFFLLPAVCPMTIESRPSPRRITVKRNLEMAAEARLKRHENLGVELCQPQY